MSKKDCATHEIEAWELKDFHPAGANGPQVNANLNNIIRKSYREPIQEEEQIFAEIKGQKYKVFDIGNHGIGIAISALDTFSAGTPCDIHLHIGENPIALHGEIAYTSPSEATGECRCGIKLIRMNSEIEQKLQQFLLDHHSQLFGKK